MEKSTDKHNLIRVVITGPESTGKTSLSERLSKHYNTPYIPEYAREYVTDLKRSYTLEDVIYIAEKQTELDNHYAKMANKVLFYDTYLIITKVWLDVVFNHQLPWIDKILNSNHIDMYLLCFPDIPWVPDPVRENGGEMRNVLFKRYQNELKQHNCVHHIIRGKQRFEAAVGFIDELINKKQNIE